MINFDLLDNVHKLLVKAKKVKNETDSCLKIAVLGSYSTQFFTYVLRYLLKEEGIYSNIYEGEYDSISWEICDSTSQLYNFGPDAVILLPHVKDIVDFPNLLETPEQVQEKINSTIRYYQDLWDRLEALNVKYIIQSNFVIPNLSQLGNMENEYCFSRTNFLRKVNEALIQKKYDNVCIADLESIASNIGKNQWFDYGAYFVNKSGFRLEYIGYVVYLFVQIIKAYQGKIRKCLVLDLDNTIWGGVVADDGYDKIQLDPNHPIGEAYQFFQEYILLLKNRGIILAVCSKNEETLAKEPFLKNEFMKLRLEDISCFVANWEEKPKNIIHISNQLDIGLDSIVFFDDNPIERELVRKNIPKVHVIEVSENPENYVQDLERERPFEWLGITNEDTLRTQSYHANAKRMKMVCEFEDYKDFLAALKMQGEYGLVNEISIERFVQLVNKSNQFNLRTIRYTRDEIMEMSVSEDYRCIYIKLKDKFTNYGIISCVILRKNGMECFIDSWIMSCRVLRREVEKYTFGIILKYAKSMKCKSIVGEYLPTKKNNLVKNLYSELGFKKDMSDGNQAVLYRYENIKDTFLECPIMG